MFILTPMSPGGEHQIPHTTSLPWTGQSECQQPKMQVLGIRSWAGGQGNRTQRPSAISLQKEEKKNFVLQGTMYCGFFAV